MASFAIFPTVFKTYEKRLTDVSLKRNSQKTFLIPKFVIANEPAKRRREAGEAAAL